jgi:hypothetical protein
MLVSMVATASVAAAPGNGCGMVITQSTVLTADIGPCGKGGIVIAADDIRIDLNGHSITGKSSSGDGVGVLFDGTDGSWVLNGTVSGFDAGVAIVGGAGNTVWGMTIKDNIGSLKATRPAYGDGVAIRSSGGNWITRSSIVNNGPFGGISIFGDGAVPEDINVIQRNRIVDNDVARATTNEDSGIRLDGPGVSGMYIQDNTILGNGLDGISVAAAPPGVAAWSVYILENVVAGNGFHAMSNRKGDGIVVSAGADLSLLNDNEVTGNAANGIRVGSLTTRVIFNTVTGNVAYPGVSAFDLNEETAGCADNEWAENVFGSASQTCVQ